MALSEAKKITNAKYNKKTYERMGIIVRRDAELNGDAIRAHAEEMNESLNGFLKRAIAETVASDNNKIALKS